MPYPPWMINEWSIPEIVREVTMNDQSNTPVGAEVVDVAKRVNEFVQLRDIIKKIEDKHEAELAPYKKGIEDLKAELGKALTAFNVTNMKTPYGTVSVKTKISASAADINMFWAFVVTQGNFDMIDKKPNVTAITDYVKQNGVPPPGVNYNIFHDIGVRRS